MSDLNIELRNERDDLRGRLREYEFKEKLLRRELGYLQNKLANVTEELDSWRRSRELWRENRRELEQRIEDKNDLISKLQSKAESLETSKFADSITIAKLKKQVSELEEQLRDSKSAYDELQEDLNS